MTARERILRALKREPVDRMPWAPLIDGYYLSGLSGARNQVDAVIDFGGDVMARHIPTYLSVYDRDESISLRLAAPPPANEQSAPEEPGVDGFTFHTEEVRGQITRVIKTPSGELRGQSVRNEASPHIPFPIEHTIKTPRDLEVYEELARNNRFRACYDIFVRESEYIGDRGIATTTGPSSPFHILMESEMGMACFYYMLDDEPGLMRRVMDAIHRKNLEAYAIIADSPAEVVICYENTSTTTQSPALYEAYVREYLNEYADVLHRKGKLFLSHMCGKLRGLAGQIHATRLDGIVDIAPEPTGDVSLGEAHALWGGEKAVLGGIDATAFRGLSAPEMEAYAENIINALRGKNGVLLGSGDATPLHTPFDNLLAVTRAVNRYCSMV